MPDELREVVDDYWGQFPPQHPLIKDAFGVLFGLLYIVSFFGNGCVLYVFLGTPSLRTPVRHISLHTHHFWFCLHNLILTDQLLHPESGILGLAYDDWSSPTHLLQRLDF